MTLAFSLHINGVATNFPEKIIAGLASEPVTQEIANYIHSDYYCSETLMKCIPKIHTIRRDSHDRWKVGNKTHAVINNRTSKRLQFVQTLACLGIQKFKIEWNASHLIDDSDSHFFYSNWQHHRDKEGHVIVWVDNRRLTRSEVYTLAENDGFDSINQFFDYFNQDFEGKIIHWTDCEY